PGGVLSLTDEVDTPQFTPAEIAALVDETHRLRKKVAVHCHGDQAAKDAIEAGVDSIEHGSFLKPETLQLMKTKGTYLVPTLMATEWILAKLDSYPLALQAKAKAAGAARTEMFRNAVKLGVKIALGTDAAVYPHGQNAKEFKLMVDLGMPAVDRHRAGGGVGRDRDVIADVMGVVFQVAPEIRDEAFAAVKIRDRGARAGAEDTDVMGDIGISADLIDEDRLDNIFAGVA